MSRRDRIGTLRRWCLNLHADAFSKSVLHVLIQYADGNGQCYPSTSRIAREAGMSLRKARTVIRALELAGHLLVCHSAGRDTNRYTIISDPAQPR